MNSELNVYYRNDLEAYFKYNIIPNKRVLEIGCGEGNLLYSCEASYGLGIDISENNINIARQKYPRLNFINEKAENLKLEDAFDYILISDTLSLVGDVQTIFNKINPLCTNDTRIIISTYNYLWKPLVLLAEYLHIKKPSVNDNWLTHEDMETALYLEGFQVIKKGRRLLIPIEIPIVSDFINKYIAPLPIINLFCLTNTLIARKLTAQNISHSVSVIVPVKNEAGNIENVITGLTDFKKDIEIVFVEGGSTDNSEAKINEMLIKHRNLNIKSFKQSGKGKADAVRLGFDKATSDILMILDADLTVEPLELAKFYNVFKENKGEFVFGSRLVYSMEKDAMLTLNIFGNKFFSQLFSWLLDTKIKDTLCGTKAISKLNYNNLVKNREYFGDFDPFGDFDLILGAWKLNLKFVEIPVKYKKRKYGSTNISRFKNGLELFRMVLFALDKVKFI